MTQKTKPFAQTGATTYEVLNAMRLDASQQYQERVPELAQENFDRYASAILGDPTTMNEWLNTLINRIGLVVIQQRSWSNPLAMLKSGVLEMGDTVEEIFTDLIQEKVYEDKSDINSAGKVWATSLPPTHVIFHKQNREAMYDISFNDKRLKQAFVNFGALERFIAGIYNTLDKSDNLDEYLYMKQLLSNYAEKDLFYKVKVDEPVNEATAKDLMTKIKEYATNSTFLSRKYNSFNVYNHADREEQILFVSSKIDAFVDVNVLASAFNMDKVNFQPRKIVIDTMPEGAHAILTSREFLRIYDTVYRIEDIYNPRTMEWKYFLHHHQILSTSRFENAIMFTSKDVVEPASVTVTRVSAEEVLKGNSTQIKAVVKDAEDSDVNVSQAVLFTVSGNTDVNTVIDGNGFLRVGLFEKATSITVKATVVHNEEITGELAVAILE